MIKKILAILVLSILLNNTAYTKDYTGKKLNCAYESKTKKYNKYAAIEFLENNELRIYATNTPETSQWKINANKKRFYVTPKRINFVASTSYINRENLELRRYGTTFKCEIMSKDWDAYKYLETILEKLILDQENKNVF